jgi:hypothetical protein
MNRREFFGMGALAGAGLLAGGAKAAAKVFLPAPLGAAII